MLWIIPFVLGWVGGMLSFHWIDDEGWYRNPPRCIWCVGFSGGFAAIIIEMVIASPQIGATSFLEHAVLNIGSGVFGATLLGGGYALMRGTTNR